MRGPICPLRLRLHAASIRERARRRGFRPYFPGSPRLPSTAAVGSGRSSGRRSGVGPGAITAAAGGAGGERPSNAPVSSRWSRQPRSADDADHGQRPVHRHRRRRPLGPQRDDRGGRRLPFHRVVLLHRLAVRGDRCVVQFADPEPDEPAADRPGDRARDRCGRRVRARARGRLGHVVRRRDSDLAGAPLR